MWRKCCLQEVIPALAIIPEWEWVQAYMPGWPWNTVEARFDGKHWSIGEPKHPIGQHMLWTLWENNSPEILFQWD